MAYINGKTDFVIALAASGLPKVTEEDNGKVMRVVEGEWAADGMEDVAQRLGNIEQNVADLMYEPIVINSFSGDVSTVEKGRTINEITFSWSLNKIPTKLTIGSVTPPLEKTGSVKIDGLELVSNHDYYLVAKDERNTQVSKKASVTFCNGVYYGVSTIPETYDSAFIIALGKSGKKTLRSSKLASFEVTAGAGNYIYYCLPKSMGTCQFTVGGFDGGFDLVATIAYTNEYGHEEQYYIYRSTNAGLGATTVGVK